MWLREPVLVARTTFRARRDARVGIREPENTAVWLIGAPPEAFDATMNNEHRRLQQQRNRTSRIEELRDDERAALVAAPERGTPLLTTALVFLVIADALCAAGLLHTTLGYGPGPSAFLGLVFACSFVWLISRTRDGAGRWLAIGVAVLAVAALVVLRLQSLAAEEGSTVSGNAAAAVVFALLTIGPAMIGERIARILRDRRERGAAVDVTHELAESEAKVVAGADKEVRTTIATRSAYDRLYERLIAVYDREWKFERARLELA
jgi:hypothetical protein